jgi:hypothetical protein
MKRRWFLLILLALALLSTTYLSTLARFSAEYAGLDAILVAKWNFGARGEEDIEGVFYNKGFTFDLFNAQSVQPLDHGKKSFTFTGGGSDVGIIYDVEMKVQELLSLATGTVAKEPGVAIDAPFIFRITAEINGGATDVAPRVFSPCENTKEPGMDSGWFRPGDVQADEDGFFSIFEQDGGAPSFSPGSQDQVTITVEWQWNTSFYIGATGVSSAQGVVPDASLGEEGGFLPYYQEAYDGYYGSGGWEAQRITAAQAVIDYLAAYGGLPGGPPPGGNGNGSPEEEETPELEEQELGEGENLGEQGAGEGEEPEPEGPEPEEQEAPEPGGGEQQTPDPGEPEPGEGGEADPEPGGQGSGEQGGEPEGDPSENGYASDPFDYEYYNQLVAAEHAALEACETSLMAAYDDYDTLAVEALVAREAVKVIFRIRGEQRSPEQGNYEN